VHANNGLAARPLCHNCHAGLTEEMLEEAVVRGLKRAKSDQVSISAFNAGHWGRMSQRLGVKMELCPSHQLAVAEEAEVAPVDAFQWTDAPEPSQGDRCVASKQRL
jgi:hypothetical protein